MTQPRPSRNPNLLRRLAVWITAGLFLAGLTWFITTSAFDGWFALSEPAAQEKQPRLAEEPRVSDDVKVLLDGYRAQQPQTTAPAQASAAPSAPTTTDLTPLQEQMKQLIDAQRGTNAALEILIKAHERPSSPPPSTGKVETDAEREAERKAKEKAHEERIQKAKEWKPVLLDGELPKESSGAIHRLKTPYALAPSTVINFVTESQVSNQTKGPFRAFVSLPVCDSATHSHVVIPQGSVFLMEITGQTLFGDESLAVGAHTLRFPNGTYVKMDGAAAGDRTGQAGFRDQVEHHYLRTFAAAIFSSGLRAGASMVALGGQGVGQRVGGAVAGETAAQGAQEVRQYLRTEPTITIRGGYEGLLYLRDELPLAEPYPVGPDGPVACGGVGLGG